MNEDFPLRGFVECADCGTPLTACWSSGQYSKYPYYLCPKRECVSYRKSIRPEKIEGEFGDLLRTVQPTDQLFRIASSMLKRLWDHRVEQGRAQAKALGAEVISLDRQVGQFLERVVEATVPSVIAAYEDKIAKLEERKLLLHEKMSEIGKPRNTYEQTVRTALAFLASPWNLWNSGQLDNQRTVLKLAFGQRLAYSKQQGFRTANLSLPFSVLAGFSDSEKEMARQSGQNCEHLFCCY